MSLHLQVQDLYDVHQTLNQEFKFDNILTADVSPDGDCIFVLYSELTAALIRADGTVLASRQIEKSELKHSIYQKPYIKSCVSCHGSYTVLLLTHTTYASDFASCFSKFVLYDRSLKMVSSSEWTQDSPNIVTVTEKGIMLFVSSGGGPWSNRFLNRSGRPLSRFYFNLLETSALSSDGLFLATVYGDDVKIYSLLAGMKNPVAFRQFKLHKRTVGPTVTIDTEGRTCSIAYWDNESRRPHLDHYVLKRPFGFLPARYYRRYRLRELSSSEKHPYLLGNTAAGDPVLVQGNQLLVYDSQGNVGLRRECPRGYFKLERQGRSLFVLEWERMDVEI